MRIRLGNNEHAIALILDRIGHNFFRAAVAVHLRGIDQCHAELDSESQGSDFILMRRACSRPCAMCPDPAG